MSRYLPPKHLNDSAKAEWKRVVPLLTARRVLSDEDLAALVIYCTSYAQYLKAQAEIDKSGEVVTNDKGRLQKSPWCQVQNHAWDKIVRLITQLGLSPKAREHQKGEQPKDDGETF